MGSTHQQTGHNSGMSLIFLLLLILHQGVDDLSNFSGVALTIFENSLGM